MTNKTYTFSEGMFENVPGTMLGTDKALYIENVRKNGIVYENEKDLDNPSSTIFASYTKRYIWRSANKLTGAYSNNNYVCTNTDYLRLFYEETAGVYKAYGTDYSIANGNNFFYATSPEQFIFVDGQDGNIAKRITINVDGELNITQIGVTAPVYPATIVSINSDKTAETGQGTGIPAGVNIQYVHTDINEFGEESNPSPILSISTANGLYRGEMNGTVFEFDAILKGETIKTILTLDCGQYAVKKRLYRRWGGYSASPLSISDFYMVNEYNIMKGQTSITVIDSFVDSAIAVSYDKDIAGKADDVILFNDTIVLGNTSVTTSLPVAVTKAWQIKITNNNIINYTDAVIRLDLFDLTFKNVLTEGEYLDDLIFSEITGDIASKMVFVHGDMTTPLNSVFYGLDTTQRIPVNMSLNFARKVSARFEVKIPYLVAGVDNYIYLAYKSDSFSGTIWNGYTKNLRTFQETNYTAIDTVYDFIKPKSEDNYICYNNYVNPLYPNVTVTNNVASKEFIPDTTIVISANDSVQFAILNSYSLSTRFIPRDTPKSMSFTTNMFYLKDNNNIVINDKITSTFWFTIDKMDALPVGNEYILSELGCDQRERYFVLKIYSDSSTLFLLRVYRHEGDGRLVLYGSLGLPTVDFNYVYSYYITLSLNTSLLDISAPDNSKTDFSLYTLAYEQNGTTGVINTTKYNNTSGIIEGFGFNDKNLKFTLVNDVNGLDVYYSQVSVENNKYYDVNDNGDMRFLNSVSHLPDYPIEGIGLDYDHNNTVVFETNSYEKNKNISFSLFETQINNKDGYIRFGKEYIPDVNEINVNEKILRLASIPSYLEDGYQNTIFAFCPSNIYRIAISRDATIAKYEVINELQGVGLYSNKSLAMSDRHIYWIANNKSIMRYGKDGIKDIGINKVNPGTNVNLYYCAFNRTLYLSGAICYQIDYDYFYYYKSSYTIIDPNDSYNGISFRSTGKFREFSATNLTGKIVSGMIPALMKIKRFLTNKDLDLTINIYSNKVGTDTQVIKFVIALDGNRRTYFGKGLTGTYLNSNLIHLSPYAKQSIANLKADFINLEITFDNGFEFLNIEDGG